MKEARPDTYASPLSARYSSPEMSYLFSPYFRALLFRRLWIALAQGEQKLGLPISQKQLSEMKKKRDTIDFLRIQSYEKKFRHDVMAHLYAFGDLCPHAKPILHLGATSTYVTDNADLIILKEALSLLFAKLIALLRLLKTFAKRYAKNPCLGFTHFQSAQPTTIGKRCSLWLQDHLFDALEWERLIEEIPFLGVKGATGTQSSFLSLFEGDAKRVQKLERFVAAEFRFQKILPIAGQTYSRKIDLSLLNALASFAASAHKLATDIRLLAHEGELSESFEKEQVGSSAMPYKQNPICAERACGIARFVMALSQNPAYTTATQWLERSLDDSANRRLAIPEAFLGTDALLNLLCHLFSSLKVHPKRSLSQLEEKLPYLIMENVLMAAVKKGGDRQKLHEALRRLARIAEKQRDPLSFLLNAIENRASFSLSRKELKSLFNPSLLTGRAEEQVLDFLENEVEPLLKRHKNQKAPIQPVAL